MSESTSSERRETNQVRLMLWLCSMLGVGGMACTSGQAKEPAEAERELAASSVAPPEIARIRAMMCQQFERRALDDRGDVMWSTWRDDCFRRAEAIDKVGAESRRMLEVHWSIPEYHDEQRLRDGPANSVGTFGPVAFLYAMPQLSTYSYLHQIDAQSPRGTLVALVVIEDPTDAALPGSYQRLNLRKGVNCVWLAHQRGAPVKDRWSAYIGRAERDTTCDRHAQPNLPELEVHRSVASQSLDDYPPVVRFSEGVYRGELQPLIGVTCLAGWCDIGPKEYTDPTPLPAAVLDALPAGARERRTKGWSDEQWLARKEGDQFIPAVHAALVPAADVGGMSGASFANWTYVATLWLGGAPPPGSKYARWGLQPGRNDVMLRGTPDQRDWLAEIRVPAPGADPRTGPMRSTGVRWRVARTPHFDEAVPGTVRFRWTEYDDEIWVPCGQACCQLTGT